MTKILRILCVVLALAPAFPAAAQGYPTQPIKLISPFPPGGSVDITARLIAEPLGGQLGTRIVIENRSGASGNIGMELAARAAPDGYTLVMNTIPLVTNMALFDRITWDPIKDFVPIGMVATAPHVLVVNPKLPVHSVDELLRLARANPGKLSYSSAGFGTTFHLCGEVFKDSTRTFILHVPYRGGGPALQDALSGQVDLSFPTLAAALPHVKAGTLRALAVTGATRSPQLPNVPTLLEAGVKDAEFTQWLALLAPAGTSPAVVTRLNAALKAALESKAVREKFEANAMEAFVTTPDEAGNFIAAEATRLAKLIKARGIKAD